MPWFTGATGTAGPTNTPDTVATAGTTGTVSKRDSDSIRAAGSTLGTGDSRSKGLHAVVGKQSSSPTVMMS